MKVTPEQAAEVWGYRFESCLRRGVCVRTFEQSLAHVLNSHAAKVLEEAAKACDQVTAMHGFHSNHVCAAAIRRMAEEVKC